MDVETLGQGLLFCSSCGARKPSDDFSAQQRNADGSVARFDSCCLACRRRSALERRGSSCGSSRSPRRTERPSPSLPAAPFREWLETRLVMEGVWDRTTGKPRKPNDRAGNRSLSDLAADWGTSPKRLYDIMNGLATVSFTMVDRILCRSGQPYALAEIYRDLDAILGHLDEELEAA
jgi:hypothetical protein